MTFTIVFQSITENITYMLAFEPCPVWKKNRQIELVPNNKNPHYELGSFKKLIEHEDLFELVNEKKCAIVIHNEGHGTDKDLKNLITDLENEGFSCTVCSL